MEKNMKILYLPFTVDEAMYDLFPKALKWCHEYRNKGQEVPVIIHHQSEVPSNVQKALESGDCKIYILSHGINKPELVVGNQTELDEDYQEISIDEIAERFTLDLISPKFNNDNIVKLFFCDEFAQDNKARRMAEQFRSRLDKAHENMEVKYYTDVSIGRPGTGDEKFGAKLAVRQHQMNSNLFMFQLTCRAGNAKSFRHGLNEPANNSMQFFSPPLIDNSERFAEFSHPILIKLANAVTDVVLADKILGRNQEAIIKDIVDTLPNQVSDYLVDSLTIEAKNAVLQMKINKPLLKAYLLQEGVITSHDDEHLAPAQVHRTNSVWIDEEDYLGISDKITTSDFTEIDNESTIFSLTDFNEVLSYQSQQTEEAEVSTKNSI